MQDNNMVSTGPDSFYTISSAAEEDSGTYSCFVEINGVASSGSIAFALRVVGEYEYYNVLLLGVLVSE